MANTKKIITQADAKEILNEDNGLTMKEKTEIILKCIYLSDAKKEIKKLIENKTN